MSSTEKGASTPTKTWWPNSPSSALLLQSLPTVSSPKIKSLMSLIKKQIVKKNNKKIKLKNKLLKK